MAVDQEQDYRFPLRKGHLAARLEERQSRWLGRYWLTRQS